MNALKRMLAAMAALVMPAIGLAGTQQVGDYTWSFTIANGEAAIEYGGSATCYGGTWYGSLETLERGAGYKAKFGKAGALWEK